MQRLQRLHSPSQPRGRLAWALKPVPQRSTWRIIGMAIRCTAIAIIRPYAYSGYAYRPYAFGGYYPGYYGGGYPAGYWGGYGWGPGVSIGVGPGIGIGFGF